MVVGVAAEAPAEAAFGAAAGEGSLVASYDACWNAVDVAAACWWMGPEEGTAAW